MRENSDTTFDVGRADAKSVVADRDSWRRKTPPLPVRLQSERPDAALPAPRRAALPTSPGNVGVTHPVDVPTAATRYEIKSEVREPVPASGADIIARAERILLENSLDARWKIRTSFTSPSGEEGRRRERPLVAHQQTDQALAGLTSWLCSLSPSTSAQYGKKAGMLARKFDIELNVGTSSSFAASVLRHCETVSASSRRVYRSAAAHALADLVANCVGRNDLHAALAAYLVVDSVNVDAETGFTRGAELGHARRSRDGFPDSDLAAFVQALRQRKSSRKRRLKQVLHVLILTGMRPSELCHAVVDPASYRDEVVVAEGSPRGRRNRTVPVPVTVTIKNGKFDPENPSSRAHGSARTLCFPPDVMSWTMFNTLSQVLEWSGSHDRISWDAEIEGLGGLMREVSGKLWPRRSRRPTLYSCRHQFAANVKLAYEDRPDAAAVVAALMGHASDDTAHHHYARKNKGSRKAVVPRPTELEVARIRAVREGRTAHIRLPMRNQDARI